MNIKISGSAGMLALVFGVSVAQADLTGLPVTPVSTQNSNLFLAVWDPTAQFSYSADLGVNLLTFISEAATTNLSWNLDSAFASFHAAGNPLQFNIAAANQISPKATTDDALLLSHETGSTWGIQQLTEINLVKNQNNVVGYENYLRDYYSIYGSQIVNGNPPAGTPVDPAYFNFNNGQFWGVGQAVPNWIASTTVGGGGLDQLSVISYQTNGAALPKNGDPTIVTQFSGYFSLDTTNNTLTWTSNATAVPVPGAVWLFLGGLMSLMGMMRRKKT
jgi:hypothetical protein